MRLKLWYSALIALLCATPVVAQTANVTPDFNSYRYEWPRNSGALELRWAAIEQAGNLLICGAVRHINPRSRKANRGLLRKGWVRAGSDKGEIALRDLSYFRDARDGPLAGAKAGCRPAKPGVSGQSLHLGFDPHNGYDAHMDMF